MERDGRAQMSGMITRTRRRRYLTVVVGALAVAATVFGVGAFAAPGDPVQHGIALTKGCVSPTKIGDPYTCTYTIQNIVDDAHDTLTINGLTDIVHSAGGDVDSGNIFSTLKLVATGGATCSGAGISGAGTIANPYTGATSCTLPFNSRIDVQAVSHYNVQAADFALPDHELEDDVSLNWTDLCNDPALTGNSNCNPNPAPATAASLTVVQQLTSATATNIHNAAHQIVTAVAAGATVHDVVTVTGEAGKPTPTGNVTFQWFMNNTCTGTAAATSGNVVLDGSGQADATAFPQGPLAPGLYGFKATYLGDATYTGSVGACEPLAVVDANIQITPPTAVNQVGSNHTLTGHVNVNDGTGPVNAPAGTLITFSLPTGTATFVGGVNTCTTVGTTGECTVQITSGTTGTSTIQA